MDKKTIKDIYIYPLDNNFREKMGLPEDATWEKIDEARKGEGLRDND